MEYLSSPQAYIGIVRNTSSLIYRTIALLPTSNQIFPESIREIALSESDLAIHQFL